MSFFELAANRYSVRDFLPRQIEPDKLEKILQAGKLAPTAHNNQPQQIYVVQEPKMLAELKDLTRCVFNAPTVLLMGGKPAEAWVNPFSDHDSCEMDVSIVATHMMLQAAELGIGSTWVCYAPLEEIKNKLNLPKEITLYALLILGYPSDSAKPSPMHCKRKELEHTVHYVTEGGYSK